MGRTTHIYCKCLNYHYNNFIVTSQRVGMLTGVCVGNCEQHCRSHEFVHNIFSAYTRAFVDAGYVILIR